VVINSAEAKSVGCGSQGEGGQSQEKNGFHLGGDEILDV